MVKTVEKERSESRADRSCCEVESVISVDQRGQMVLPKVVREKAGIVAGDKLAVVSMKKDEEVCCISLIKIEQISEMVTGMLGPLMSEVSEDKGGN